MLATPVMINLMEAAALDAIERAAAAGPPEPRHASQCRALCGDAGRHGIARDRGRHPGRRAHGRVSRRGVRRQGARRRRDAHARRRQRRALRSTGPTQARSSHDQQQAPSLLHRLRRSRTGDRVRPARGRRRAASPPGTSCFPKTKARGCKQAGETIGARLATSAADAVANSDIIVSAVTAASSLEAAQSVAPHISGNPYYLDVNSVSPGRKQETAQLLGRRRALRRRRDPRADPPQAPPDAAAARGPARAGR